MKLNTRSSRAAGSVAGALTVLLTSTLAGNAAPVTISDNGASLTIDPMLAPPGQPSGAIDWTVGGVNHLYDQWFYYRVGTTSTGDYERSIDELGPVTVSGVSGDQASFTYTGVGFTVTVSYNIDGYYPSPGRAGSTLGELIKIVNTSGSPLALQFFQFSDFDLGGVAEDDVVHISKSSGLFDSAYQSDPTSGITFNEAVVDISPRANYGSVAISPALFNLLEDGNRDNLGTVAALAGPDDVSFAFQWDLLLAASGAGSEVLISKQKTLEANIIPEPTTFSLLFLGAAALAFRRSNRQSES
jgi:hypothetical protein